MKREAGTFVAGMALGAVLMHARVLRPMTHLLYWGLVIASFVLGLVWG